MHAVSRLLKTLELMSERSNYARMKGAEVEFDNKEAKFKYFQLHWPFENTKEAFDREFSCGFCQEVFIANEFKMARNNVGVETIHCKYYPHCDGIYQFISPDGDGM